MTQFLFVYILISLICCFLVNYLWSRRKLYLLSAKLQGPSGFPLVGNALPFLYRKNEIFDVFLDFTTSYSSPSKLWLGPKLMVVVKDPDQLQIILKSSKISTKASFYRFSQPFSGQGLITSSGPLHKWHKKLLQPLFSQKRVDGYSYLFQSHADKFVEKIRKHVDGAEFDIIDELHGSIFESTMDILLEDKNDHTVDYNELSKNIRRFYDISFTRLKAFWLHSDFIFKQTSFYKEVTQMKQMADAVIEDIMNTTVVKVLQRLESGEKMSQLEETRPPSVLEMIIEMVLENPKFFSVQQVVDHLMTLIGASQDTTSTTVSFICMMLGAHPHVQKLVVDELKEVLGQKTTLDYVDLSKLTYLEMCIKETMRLYAIVPFTFRETTEDFLLGNITIPKDVIVALSIYHVHRDPKFWEKPNQFYPEHFTAEATRKRHPFAFIPFSAGPRKCIAQFYSYTNLKMLVATILLNYEIESCQNVDDIKLIAGITIRPLDGHFIKIRKRSPL